MQQFNMKQKEEYKETELGMVPEDWKVVKISSICKTQAGGTPSTFKEEYWNGDIPWINSGALKNVIIKTPSKFITKFGLDNSNTKLWPKNTVVIALTGATTGMVGLLNFNCSANQSVVGILPNEKFDSFYFFYNLVYSRERILGFCSGAAQPHINKGIVDNFITLFPPIPEQKKIANVLSTIQEAKEKTEN
jgi:restriction endonuclease S subunit